MTIDDLFYTCYPKHATQPTRVTPDTAPQAADDAEKIPQAATAENAGNMAEKVIENITPDTTGNMPETTTTGNMLNNESAAGAEMEN